MRITSIISRQFRLRANGLGHLHEKATGLTGGSNFV